jgi:DNA-binding NtrC family response regulator
MLQPARLLFGRSPAMTKLLGAAERYARSRHPLLILGQRGTGKTVLARYIHDQSGRTGEFRKVSVPNIPENLEYSYLAGHARGAFTGAHEDRIGLLESAHRGTLFLDELAETSPRVQEILLQLLDDGSVRRVGEVRDRTVDVRFVGATNADLHQLTSERRFRADLLDRFGFLTLRIPPLAERRDEILPLAEVNLMREAGLIGIGEQPVLSEQARAAFMVAPWPGNVRELEAVCRYAVLNIEPGRPIGLDGLPPEFVASVGEIVRARCVASRVDLHEALAQAAGNKSRAARAMGISRRHLYRLLECGGKAV